ncbi:uncharacterized protein LOC128932140 [Callithrix jacchus]
MEKEHNGVFREASSEDTINCRQGYKPRKESPEQRRPQLDLLECSLGLPSPSTSCSSASQAVAVSGWGLKHRLVPGNPGCLVGKLRLEWWKLGMRKLRQETVQCWRTQDGVGAQAVACPGHSALALLVRLGALVDAYPIEPEVPAKAPPRRS